METIGLHPNLSAKLIEEGYYVQLNCFFLFMYVYLHCLYQFAYILAKYEDGEWKKII